MPGLGPHPGTPVEDLIPIGIPKKEFDAFAEKLVRGATYVMNRRLVENGEKIVILPPMHETVPAAAQINAAIRTRGVEQNVGPGFRVGKARTWFSIPPSHIECPCEVFRFAIWGRVIIYACLVS
jgi:hypothetical protein